MFSIIIVNWNGEAYLEKFFQSLVNQTFKDFIVYFVDNGSTDKSLSITDKFKEKINLRIIKLEKNNGFAEANNIAIEKAMYDNNKYILTINNDIELNNKCLEYLNKAIVENKDYDVFQVLMINYYNRDVVDAAGIRFKNRFYVEQIGYKDDITKIPSYSTKISGACAGAAAYSKKALLSVKDNFGFFDKNFFAYYEDVDLALRLNKNNYKTFLVKEAKVFHIHSGTSLQDSPFKTYYLTRNFLLFLYKNLDKSTYNTNKLFYYMSLIKKGISLVIKLDLKGIQAFSKAIKDFLIIRKNYTK
jgi:GT2 family glycosyltransferase